MQEIVPEAMPKFFENWCQKFDGIFSHTAQREHFREYMAGLISGKERKNIAVMSANTIGSSYTNLHHFLHDSPWDEEVLNSRRLELVEQTRQTRLSPDTALIIDDSGHRKKGEHTDGVGRQYIGQIGKVDNGVVMVTSHLVDGERRLPLDVEAYKSASSLPYGKDDAEFRKKSEIAINLIDRCLARGFKPAVTIVDSGYGNNGPFLQQLEERGLAYVAALVKTRILYVKLPGDGGQNKHRLDEVIKTITPESLKEVQLKLEKPRKVWVATMRVHFPKLPGQRTLAIQLNAPTVEEATEIDYFLTNMPEEIATTEKIARTYSKRNWVEVFYREAKGWLGIHEYQVRDGRSMKRHWILVFTAFTFVQWLRLTGGLRRQWSTEPLNTFGDAFRALRHAIDCALLCWLPKNLDVFIAHRANLGLKFA